MSTTTSAIRVALLLAVVGIGVLDWGAGPASSQPQGEGALRPYAIPASGSQEAPLSPGSPGHVDSQFVLRVPPEPWGARLISDNILFTADLWGGLGAGISSADVQPGDLLHCAHRRADEVADHVGAVVLVLERDLQAPRLLLQ